MNKGIHFVTVICWVVIYLLHSVMHCLNWVLGGKVSQNKLATAWF